MSSPRKRTHCLELHALDDVNRVSAVFDSPAMTTSSLQAALWCWQVNGHPERAHSDDQGARCRNPMLSEKG